MSIAFLIGAGATRALYDNAPLSKDYFSILKSQNSALFNVIKSGIKERWPVTLEKTDIEILMKESYNFTKSINTHLNQCIYKSIVSLLGKPTKSDIKSMTNLISNPHTVVSPTLYNILLLDDRFEPRNFFLNLNYDLVLDREIFMIRKRIDYGLDPSLINSVISKPFPLTNNNDNRYSVYHLHGAINWQIAQPDKINIWPGAILPEYNRSGSSLCLVPPGLKKWNNILERVWIVAENRLLQAKELVIIGSSLNPEDTELMDLINKFVDKRGSDNVKIIHKETTLNNYKKSLGSGYKEFPYGFLLDGPKGIPGSIEFIFS